MKKLLILVALTALPVYSMEDYLGINNDYIRKSQMETDYNLQLSQQQNRTNLMNTYQDTSYRPYRPAENNVSRPYGGYTIEKPLYKFGE